MQILQPVRDLVTERLIDIEPTATLREAASLLDEEAVGVLLVRDPRGLLGIVSERDLVRALSDGADPDDTRLDEYLTDDVLTLADETSLVDVLRHMRHNAIRHVVVEDEDGRFGVVSMRAVLEALLADVLDANAPAA